MFHVTLHNYIYVVTIWELCFAALFHSRVFGGFGIAYVWYSTALY